MTAVDTVTTREKILAATREIYERNGTRGTTTREIAERAGVNEATIFRHFGNKHALLEEMRAWSCDFERVEHAVANVTGTLETDLLAICLEMYAGIKCNEPIIKIALAEEAQDPGCFEITWRGPQRIHETVIEYLSGQIERGVISGNPRRLASFLMGECFALAMRGEKMRLSDPTADPPTVLRDFIDVFINGVRSK